MELVKPDIGTIIWMTVVFGIVMFILRKYAWKPILGFMKDRENTISESLKSAEKAKEEMKKLQVSNEKILQEAKLERDQLMKEAREAKEMIIAEAKQKASEEGHKLVEAAKQSIKNEKAAAINEIKLQISQLSLSIAEQILKEKLKDDKTQAALIQKNLDNIELN